MRKEYSCGIDGKVLLRWIFVNYIFNKCQIHMEAFSLSQSFTLYFCMLQKLFQETIYGLSESF